LDNKRKNGTDIRFFDKFAEMADGAVLAAVDTGTVAVV